ncbi:hypothetical protein N9I87_02710 [Gammaproteobacteria bacterium]|nr:hypothetical protein [Gammaproteobacteria bacterium]
MGNRRVFFVCSNTPTHTALIKLFTNDYDVILLPPGFNAKEPVISKATHLQDLINLGDIAIALYKTALLFLRQAQQLSIGHGDLVWIFVSLIEAQALKKLSPKSIFLTHHLDGAAASAVFCGAEEFLSGMHGFPVGNYGWTPVWTDIFYVYGESTNNYIIRIDPSARGKIKHYVNQQEHTFIHSSYLSDHLGIIVGGSHADFDELISAARYCLSSEEFRKLFVFRHPSRNLSYKEKKKLDSLNRPYEIKTLSSITDGACFRCIIGNSSAVLAGIQKGLIVFFAPTSLPRLDNFFRPDGVVLAEFSNILEYKYPGKDAHSENAKRQIDYHYN